MKQFVLGVLVTLAILAMSVFGYLRWGLAEVRADVNPPSWERNLMSSAVHAAVRREAPELPNPVAPTDENLITGGREYRTQCALCHGRPGSHERAIAQSPLYPPPPQFAAVGTDYSEAQIFWIAKHGIRRTGMYATGIWNSDNVLWTLAAYVKRMNALPERVQNELGKN